MWTSPTRANWKKQLCAFSPDPAGDETRVPWNLGPQQHRERRRRPSLLERVGRTAGSAFALAPSTPKLARAALLEQQLTLPFRAPRSMFNVRSVPDRQRLLSHFETSLKDLERAFGV